VFLRLLNQQHLKEICVAFDPNNAIAPGTVQSFGEEFSTIELLR
jgi:hypothetical protein